MVVFKVFSTCKTIFKVIIKSQILPGLISLWCLYCNIWTRFYLLLCTWRVRRSRLEKFYKKDVLKYSTKFTGKHLRWGFFCNKAAARRPVTSLNTESGTGAFLWFWNLYQNIYFANVFLVMPLKSKIFTGVSFRKMLSFYCKQKRQLFHYEGTSS